MGGSPALDAVLRAVAAALADHDERDERTMWVIGSPRAADWNLVAAWEGPVRAIVVPHGMYGPSLAARAEWSFGFAADADDLDHAVDELMPVPAVASTGPLAPPALGTPLGDLWVRRHRRRECLPETCGVAWVGTRGATAVAEAVAAWRRQRAVIVLAQTPPPPLGGGAALIARSTLEVDEATAFLAETPPIARALALEGHRAVDALPRPADIVAAMLGDAALGARPGSL